MHWNHRIVVRLQDSLEPLYELREIYYRDDGSIEGWSAAPVRVMGDSVKEMKQSLRWMLKAMDKPVLVEKKQGRKETLVPVEEGNESMADKGS
jgi:hypothetical protein